ncbi:Type I Iterative Polyketide synthase (PKS) [Pseudogymnoascus sp. 05NY08]|nr:Type I Iterative Polyketide synthase (PKS) [Pseudogymnoascus sp. 05NY08]
MDPNVPIAIIGMSCRFPGNVKVPEDLWQLCAEGRTGWSKIPASRFNLDGVYHPNAAKTNTTNVIGGHFLEEDLALFDAGFFNLSSEVASSLDPQYRLQLESTYEALESAGLAMEHVAGSNTSVFAGTFFRDYSEAQTRDGETLPRLFLLGVGSAMASNRISHFYDLRGASMTIDTGCSTTLIALHQGCQSLRTGESDMSIVGGANVMLNPDNFVVMSNISLLGKTGKSYAFDNRAEGYGRGEGSATVILKRLDDALRDGDPIRSIIRTSGTNQDGKTETVTTPSQRAQEELIRACYEKAGLDPAQTAYFEAHGTGTRTGDPIEARAIASVFREHKSRTEPLLVGSVKTNVGHTETTSGLASIIKVALALEKGQIPPSANFEKPNEEIDLDDWHMKIPTKLEEWPKGTIRRASVNNFGYGGANCHVVMQDCQSFIDPKSAEAKHIAHETNGTDANGSNNKSAVSRINNTDGIDGTNGIKGVNSTNGINGHHTSHTPRIIILSGKDETACEAVASNLRDYLLKSEQANDESFFASLAYTLGQRRSIFPWVSAQPAQNVSELIGLIDSGKMKPGRRMDRPPRLGFVFTGQGAQWFAMGRELFDAYPVFKGCLLEAEGYLKALGATWSLTEELKRDEKSSRVSDVALSTPLSVALQIALARLLQSWGITPSAVTSHSSGEMAAACAVGALSLDSTMASVLSRGELVGEVTQFAERKGGMIAVGLSPEDTEPYLERVSSGQLVAACMNSPTSTTVSGDASAIEELERMLHDEHIFARRLKVDAAWHSHHVQPIAKPYRAYLEKYVPPVNGELTDIVYSSPTTGTRIGSLAAINRPQHWVDSLTSPVQFVQAFRNMCFGDESDDAACEVDAVVEVGPHAALSGPIHEIKSTLPQFRNKSEISYHTCLVRKSNAVATMQALACELVRKGYPVNMEAVNFPHGRIGGGRGRGSGGRSRSGNKNADVHENGNGGKFETEGEGEGEGTLKVKVEVLHSLPSYPWTHSTRHWSEPRLNRAWRERGGKPHDLLGSLALGCNILAPSWRHVIRATDVPWVNDHLVQGNVIYPGAGYLCMAIEGAGAQARVQQPQTAIQGYQLRDVDILQALVIPESAEGVEVQLTLRPCNVKDLYATGWQEFSVSSVSSASHWLEHCKGLIKVDIQQKAQVQHGALITKDHYRRRIDPMDVYASLRSAGIYHGPIFQNLRGIRGRDKQSLSVFVVADTASTMPYQHQSPHIIHPTTLDTVFQAAYTALPGAGSKSQSSQIPKSIKHLWIAHSIPSAPGHMFNAYTNVNRATPQTFEADMSVVNDGELGAPLITVNGFVCQSIGNAPIQADSPEDQLFIAEKWVPDISFLKPAFFKQQLSCHISSIEAENLLDLRQLCIHFISDALERLTAADVKRLDSHLKKYYVWMKLQVELAGRDELAPGSTYWHKAAPDQITVLKDKVYAASVNGELLCKLGSELVSILRQERTPRDLLVEDGMLNKFYENSLKLDRSLHQVCGVLKHIVHKNPRAKILEIGAGSGSFTAPILATLGEDNSDDGPLALSYDFTDISSGVFESAKEKFKNWKNLVRYKKLDVEQDPLKQGFDEGSYDVIIACRVLSATKSMQNTMSNVRKLLKPSGKLLMVETTQDQLDTQFSFSLLPSWWLSEEEERKYSPSLTVGMWDRGLRETGFSGVDIEVPDCDEPDLYSYSVIVSTANSQSTKLNSDIVLVTRNLTPISWMDALSTSIAEATGVAPSIEPLEGVRGNSKSIYVFLGDIEGPFLKNLDSAQFEAIKALCSTSKGVLWVSRGGTVGCEQVDSSMHVGFFRCLRWEYSGKRLASVDLDPNQSPWSFESIPTITDVFSKVFCEWSTAEDIDFEFADRDGLISVLRYHKDISTDSAAFPNAAELTMAKMEPFAQPGRPLRLFIGSPGLLDSLAWGDDPDAGKVLEPDIVEVQAKAFGLNFRDVMVAMGQLNRDIMGFECSGYISRVGSNAKLQGYKPGDRVAMLLRGHWGTFARVHHSSVVKIPDDMTFEVAASLPVSFCTAYISVFDIARLRRGEKILIHAATGAFAQAAIVLAKYVGAEIFVTVGTEAKRQFVIKTYGIQPDHIFSSRDTSFAPGILAMTEGKGVDVVLNSLSGILLQESVNCLAPFGRFVEVGKRDFEANSLLDMGAFTRSISFSSFDLLAFSDTRYPEIQDVLKDVIRLFEQKVIVPVDPITVYPVSELERTYRLMQVGKHMGKIVIAMNPEDIVPVLPKTPSVKLRPDSSYLVVGGLGGIGRSVCHWMVSHGAKNIVVISRSASSQEKAAPFLAEIGKNGCKVKVAACDITDEYQLAEVLKACSFEMPPICGVIQAAMVLEDSILERMTLGNFNAGIRPKVQGTWNLHNQMSGLEIDFFIMLSSIVGVTGNASQSAYAAGGTFQDALAKYRTSKGLPCVAIDLGQTKSVGVVAESVGMAQQLSRKGLTMLSEDVVLSTIEYAILHPFSTQLSIGFNTGSGPHWEDSVYTRDLRFSLLRYRKQTSSNVNKSAAGDLGSRIAAASTLDEAVEVVVGGLTKKLMDSFMILESDVDSSKSIASYGVDSLVAVELRNMLALRAGAEVSIFDIMQSSSITALAATVALKSSHTDPLLVLS